MTANLPQGNHRKSAKDIFKAGWSLYTSDFSQYCKIALIATVWGLIPTAFNLLMNLGVASTGQPLSPGVRVLVFVVWIALTIFCAAQSLGWLAGVSRLAYQSSIGNVPDTLSETSLETPQQALRFTRSRKFSFLGASLLQNLLLFLASIALWILSSIFIVIVGLIIGSIVGSENPVAGLVFTLIFLVGFAAFVYGYLYIFSRLMLTEKPLAIEQSSGAFETIERSWQLTKQDTRRSMLVALFLSLIGLAAYVIPAGIAIAQIPSEIFQTLQTENPSQEQMEQFAQALQPFFLTLFIIGTVINIFLMPLFKTTLTALYLDLRDRAKDRTPQDQKA